MKIRILFALLSLVSLCHAAHKIIVRSGDLEMQVEYGYITGSDDGNGALLDGTVSLKNISASPVNVVTGMILGPHYATGLISYIASITLNSGGEKIKPSPGALDIVELKSGELTVLKHFQRRIGKTERKMIVAYNVEVLLKDFYPTIWTGEALLALPLR